VEILRPSRFAGAIATGLCAACCGGPAGPAVRPLDPGTPVQAQIAGGERHAFRFPIPAGHTARIVVDQGETDLAVTIVPPGGAPFDIDAREHGE
jgi:hypothetical protein